MSLNGLKPKDMLVTNEDWKAYYVLPIFEHEDGRIFEASGGL